MGVSYLKIVGERISSETRIGNQHWRLYYSGVSRIRPQICRTYTTSSGSNPKPRVGFIGWYLEKLDSNPLSTKTITTSIIYALADLSAQTISSPSSSSFDWIRTLRMAGYGFLFLGPSQHLWFNYMSKLLPQRDMVTTLKKIFLGQAIYGPANVTIFFSYNAALQGESSGEIVARLKRDLLPTLKTGLMYWPICDFATYKFVPVHLQFSITSSVLCIFIPEVPDFRHRTRRNNRIAKSA